MKQRKTVSFLMVLFMMIGMLPLTAAPAEAASTTDYPTLTKLVDGCELMYNRRITVYDNGKQVIESIGPSSVSPNQRTFVDEKIALKTIQALISASGTAMALSSIGRVRRMIFWISLNLRVWMCS